MTQATDVMRTMLMLWMLQMLLSSCSSHTISSLPLLLIVSLDGFRWDYLQLVKEAGYPTPNFDNLINEGVTVKDGGLKNIFVTKTFPNHYSIVTGMYAENHGIVGNQFYDPDLNEVFTLDDRQTVWWDNGTEGKGGEPIWMTNQKAGRLSGAYFWPGSCVTKKNASYCFEKYDHNVTMRQRIDQVVNWFKLEGDAINLGLLYYEYPDRLGHEVGPYSSEMYKEIAKLDKMMGYLVAELKKSGLYDRMNLIITSDHGLMNVSSAIYLDDYIRRDQYEAYGHSPVWNIRPKTGSTNEVYKLLTKIPDLIVYLKEEIPDRFHYRYNKRIMPIIIAAPLGYDLCHNRSCMVSAGNHGYDNDDPSMHPIFIAHGPRFKKNFKAKSFNTIDLYPLMCEILEIEPHKNDGRLENVKQVLEKDKDEGSNLDITMITFMLSVGFAAMVAGIFCIAACHSHRIQIRRGGPRWKKTVALSNSLTDGKQPLLTSDDEEEDVA